jgi:predicted kinase
LYTLLDFYAAYRAIVKLKVACLRSTEVENEEEIVSLKISAEGFARLAYQYSVQFSRPSLWVFCGLPASGKTLFSSLIAEIFPVDLYRSDVIRKDMAGLSLFHNLEASFGEGLYRPELRRIVYGQMFARAQDSLKSGRSVVLDATFSMRKWRQDAAQLASDLDTNLVFVECLSSEESIRKRLEEREDKVSISDARLQHLPGLRDSFEPLIEVPEECYVRLDTDQPSEDALMDLLDQAYAKKCAQTSILMRRKLGV